MMSISMVAYFCEFFVNLAQGDYPLGLSKLFYSLYLFKNSDTFIISGLSICTSLKSLSPVIKTSTSSNIAVCNII